MGDKRKLSNREIALVTVLVFAGLLYVCFAYVITPQYDEYLQQKQVLFNLEANREIVEIEYSKINEYSSQAGQNEMIAIERQDEISTFIEEDQIIMTMDTFVKDSGIEVTNYSFGEFVSWDTASINSSILNGGEDDGRQFVEDGKVVIQDISISASGKYEELVQFFEFIESSQRRLYVNSVSLISMEDGILSATISVSQIAYKDSTMVEEEYKLPVSTDTMVKTNIFAEYDSSNGGNFYESTTSTQEEDFVIILNDYTNVSAKFLIGARGDSDSEVYYDSNRQEEGNLTIDQTNAGYSYSYSIGDKVHYGNLDELNGDRIILEVISRTRLDTSDQVALRLNITNNTDETLEVYVLNDDVNLPRFIVGNMVGNVLIK